MATLLRQAVVPAQNTPTVLATVDSGRSLFGAVVEILNNGDADVSVQVFLACDGAAHNAATQAITSAFTLPARGSTGVTIRRHMRGGDIIRVETDDAAGNTVFRISQTQR